MVYIHIPPPKPGDPPPKINGRLLAMTAIFAAGAFVIIFVAFYLASKAG